MDILSELVDNVEFIKRDVVTVCILKTKSGFYFVGYSTAINPEHAGSSFGEKAAKLHAFLELERCYRFHLEQLKDQ